MIFLSREDTNLARSDNQRVAEVEAEEIAEVLPEKEAKKVARNLARHLLRRQRKMWIC